jgi:hypothetical protein
VRRSIKNAGQIKRLGEKYRAAESAVFALDLTCGVLRRGECHAPRRMVIGVF